MGNRLARRAIQIGLKGKMVEKYNNHIVEIQDITSFVRRQRAFVEPSKHSSLILPKEEIYTVRDDMLVKKIGLDT